MNIKNISKKIIHIGTTALMPDDSMHVADSVAETPVMKAFEKLGQIQMTEDPKPVVDPDAEKKAAEEAAKAKAKADAAAKKAAEDAAKKAAEEAAKAKAAEGATADQK